MSASSGTHIQTPTSTHLKQYNAAQQNTSCTTTIDMPASQPCSSTYTYLHYNNAAKTSKSLCYTESHTMQLASIPTVTYITPSTRNTQYYTMPYVFKTSFFPGTIKMWNNLQPVITNSTTIPQLYHNLDKQVLQSTPTSGRCGAPCSAGSEWTTHV